MSATSGVPVGFTADEMTARKEAYLRRIENIYERLIPAARALSAEEEGHRIKLELEGRRREQEERRAEAYAESARYEARESMIIKQYEKKLAVLEEVIKEKDRDLIFVKNALAKAYDTSARRETEVQHELVEKDNRIAQLETCLAREVQINAELQVWKRKAKLLTDNIIRACASVQGVPTLSLYRRGGEGEYFFTAELKRVFVSAMNKESPRTLDEEIEMYEQLKEECVLIDRDLISKAFRVAKKLAEC